MAIYKLDSFDKMNKLEKLSKSIGNAEVQEYTDRTLLFYDIEVFMYDWLIVFKNINKEVVKVFHFGANTIDHPKYVKGNHGLKELIQGTSIISYNGHYYDDKILATIIDKETPTPQDIKAVNDTIIGGRKYWKNLPEDIYSLDCFKQIGPTMPSLKRIEANMGMAIVETDVPFDIARSLTEEELQLTFEYCSYDVDALIAIYEKRVDNYFTPKRILINRILELYGDKYKYEYLIKQNITRLMSIILLDDGTNEKWDTYYLTVNRDKNENKELLNKMVKRGLPQEVVDMWNQPIDGRKVKKVKVELFGCIIEFGFGGLHGVNSDKKNNVFLSESMLDVRSLYPFIMINLQTLGEGTERFAGIVDERVKVKYSNPVLSGGLKIGINSVFGALINKYLPLFNPYAGQAVCMFGQIVLFDLCRRLAEVPTLKMNNINTDGVGFTCNDEYRPMWEKIWHEWENEWNLILEEDFFKKMVQKDVNNYVGVHEDGELKTKGGQVSKYEKPMIFQDNSLRILDKILVEAMLNNTPPMETIKENLNDPSLFMQVCSVGSKFKCAVDDNGTEISTKVNRLFAVHPEFATHNGLYKMREDGSRIVFPKLSDNLLLYNGDLSMLDLESFKCMIDKTYYCELGKQRITDWGLEVPE